MTVGEALRVAEARLKRGGLTGAKAEASALLEALLEMPRSDLLLSRTRPLTAAELTQLENWVARREAREPLQHILGVAHFYGLTLQVTPDTLIPRPETERLVELGLTTLARRLEPKVLDVGTGSGAIALAVQAERPDAVVWATDLSEAALEVAAANAARLKLDVYLTRSDLLIAPDVQAFARSADLLITNPPYLPGADSAWLSPEVRRDPPEALFSGADGLEHFRRLSAQALPLLKPGAVCLVELDPRNVGQARAESGAWTEAVIHPDLLGRDRFLLLRR
jgi:release factor glutamine methyltransferase